MLSSGVRRMKFRMPWFAVVFFVCNPAQAREVSPHAARAVETIRQLRALGLPGGSSDETGPPARVPSLLRTLNAELKELILDDLNDRTAHGIPGEDEIMDQLRAAGWEEIPSHKWNAYGEIRQINFDWKTEYDPGVLIISTQLWLPCGSADPDSAIYVFQGRARKWDLVLATESDFDPIGQQDFSGMQYQISPPDEAGRWFLVVGHVPASCRRTELALRYKVLRPGPNSEKPILISSGREVINSLYDPAFRITVQSDWFAVIEGKKRLLDDEPGVAVFTVLI